MYEEGDTHTYNITIYALSASPDSYLGLFNIENSNIDKIVTALDTANGKSGNIIAKGTISGTYTSGETVE